MKLLLVKVGDKTKVDKIIVNLAGYNIIDVSVVSGLGASDELKDYNGSLLGSLRIIFEKEKKENSFLIAIIKDTQISSATEAVERELGDLNISNTNSYIAVLPLDFFKGKLN